ncbi:hypothetical protein J2Z48_001956 [Croceifilum oryzae]|uniref:Uncharacterized protein n=1 Tax=Croceifilum oryzae TaxID=1553429 RepID=A0AAJ1TF77_9BACL|nr:hypothetical protein [Croceifilum oryzae]MDQ0417783.1 hypothetical protein [Croceifilum oryzae]
MKNEIKGLRGKSLVNWLGAMYLLTAQIVSLRRCRKASPLHPSPLRASGKNSQKPLKHLPQNALTTKDYAKWAH